MAVLPPDRDPSAARAGAAALESPSPQQRFRVVAGLSLCLAVMYGVRADLSVGVRDMREEWPSEDWTGPALSAFFVGYIAGNIPGSRLARRWGAREVLTGGVLGASGSLQTK